MLGTLAWEIIITIEGHLYAQVLLKKRGKAQILSTYKAQVLPISTSFTHTFTQHPNVSTAH